MMLCKRKSLAAQPGIVALLALWLALQQVHRVASLPAGSPLSSASLASRLLSSGDGPRLPLSLSSLPLRPSSAGRGLSLSLRASSLCCRLLTGATAPPCPSRASSLPRRAASFEPSLPVAEGASGGSSAWCVGAAGRSRKGSLGSLLLPELVSGVRDCSSRAFSWLLTPALLSAPGGASSETCFWLLGSCSLRGSVGGVPAALLPAAAVLLAAATAALLLLRSGLQLLSRWNSAAASGPAASGALPDLLRPTSASGWAPGGRLLAVAGSAMLAPAPASKLAPLRLGFLPAPFDSF